MVHNLPQQWGILREFGETLEMENEKVDFALIAGYRLVFSGLFPTLRDLGRGRACYMLWNQKLASKPLSSSRGLDPASFRGD